MYRIDIQTDHPALAPHFEEDVAEAVTDALRALADRLDERDEHGHPVHDCDGLTVPHGDDCPAFAHAYIVTGHREAANARARRDVYDALDDLRDGSTRRTGDPFAVIEDALNVLDPNPSDALAAAPDA